MFPITSVVPQRALEIKRLKQQNQELARKRENTARMHGQNASNHERTVAERKLKQRNDLRVRVTTYFNLASELRDTSKRFSEG